MRNSLQLIVKSSVFTLMLTSFLSCNTDNQKSRGSERSPNIIYILADDLGYGDLGCYGQKKIRTPNLDRMAAEGMVFTQHYSGSTVCAPSRSSLLSGLHTGNTYIRSNRETYPEGQYPIAGEVYTIAELMKDAGYVTGAFGKWGLGMNGTEGSPLRQGFDTFVGFLCQRYAHRYYPRYIWEDEDTLFMPGNDYNNKETYAADYIHKRTIDFIRSHKDTSFFLYVPSIIPHAELIVPEDSILEYYRSKGYPEKPWGIVSDNPYSGNDYGSDNFVIEGYAPVDEPLAVFASMVTRLDRQVGEILSLVDELGIAENTLIIFTSDNGPHTEAGANPDFFGSNGPFRGTKRDLYEGGIRVPMLAWWPGIIEPGSTTGHISAFWDIMPTFADISGEDLSVETDGISLLPVLMGKKNVKEHDFLYWEFYERGGRVAIRKGDWKLVSYDLLRPGKTTLELYDLENDIAEQHNIAETHPEIVKELIGLMKSAHSTDEEYDLVSALDALEKMIE
jgi:arylsulfatase A